MSLSLRDVLSGCPVAGMLVAPSGRALHANNAWESLVGGQDWLASVHPDDREVAERLVRERHEPREIRLSFREGGWRWVLVSAHACDEGATLWFQPLGAGREDVLESLERERELNALKTRFISLVSHEFRTPLTVILSSAELLEHYGAKWPDERRVQHLRKIHNAVVVMTSLLDNVGLYGRVESGSLEHRPESLDAAALVRELVADFRLALPVEQELSYLDGSSGAPLRADPKLLKIVVANLLGNALRYSPRGTPVAARSGLEGGTWVLEVRDHGIGIPPQDAERVWERFQRGSNVEGIPGTGLGLAIVRRCAEIMGANVSLRPGTGEGTVARFAVPCGDAAEGTGRNA